jgi:hypothetical protein
MDERAAALLSVTNSRRTLAAVEENFDVVLKLNGR